MRLTAKLVVITLMTVSSAFAAAPQTVVMDVKNMVCQFCELTVTKALKKVPGVEDAKVNFNQKTATVKFDPAKADSAALVKAATEAGFPSTVRR